MRQLGYLQGSLLPSPWPVLLLHLLLCVLLVVLVFNFA